MKLFFTLLVALCLLFAPLRLPTVTGSADEHEYAYACVTDENCYFYHTADLKNGVFILPQSYFVKIVEEQTSCYQIEYLTDGQNTRKIVGYCAKEKVSPVDYQPNNPYLYKYFDVTYQLDGTSGDDFLTQITVPCTYYGDYFVGTNAYCYVLRGEQFGYVPKPYSFSYERNPEYEANLPPPVNAETNLSTSPPPYLFVVALALLAPVAAFLLFKFSKRNLESSDEG